MLAILEKLKACRQRRTRIVTHNLSGLCAHFTTWRTKKSALMSTDCPFLFQIRSESSNLDSLGIRRTRLSRTESDPFSWSFLRTLSALRDISECMWKRIAYSTVLCLPKQISFSVEKSNFQCEDSFLAYTSFP